MENYFSKSCYKCVINTELFETTDCIKGIIEREFLTINQIWPQKYKSAKSYFHVYLLQQNCGNSKSYE